MASSYTPNEMVKPSTGKTVGASATNSVVSQSIALTFEGSQNLRVDMKVSAVTVGAGITAKLQHFSISAWTDLAGANASVAITANGEYSLTQLMARAADQVNMPLKKQVRVVVTTGAGSTVHFDSIKVQQGM